MLKKHVIYEKKKKKIRVNCETRMHSHGRPKANLTMKVVT